MLGTAANTHTALPDPVGSTRIGKRLGFGARPSSPSLLRSRIRGVGIGFTTNFRNEIIKGVHRLGRRLQIFDRTVDHPVYSNCLESRYLKVLWARVA